MCKDVVIDAKLMRLYVKNYIHEDMELQSELQHALDVLTYKHENVEMPFQSNVEFILACVEVGESRIFKIHLLVNGMAIQLYLKIN